MRLQILKSKIHRATVTEACLDYEGSISIDKYLMKKSGIVSYEKVHILNITNGNRVETYVIKAPAGSKSVCINGAASHLIRPNDTVIILSYCVVEEAAVESHAPLFVKVNNKNEIID